MSTLRTQKYGPVVTEDPGLSDSDFSLPPRPFRSVLPRLRPPPTSSAFPPRLSTPHGLQAALDQHPPPPELHTATVWLIRAFPTLATVSWLGTVVMVRPLSRLILCKQRADGVPHSPLSSVHLTTLFPTLLSHIPIVLFVPIQLLFLWLFSDHKAQFSPSSGAMPYLSDVGAHHKSLFFAGNACTAVFYIVTLFEERLLRAKRVMVEATEEKHLWVGIGVIDTFLGLAAGITLILLAVFDPVEWEKEHCALFITFVVCIALSGLLQTLEVEHLWHEHPDRPDLRAGTLLKWTFLLFSSACAIAFVVLYANCDGDAWSDPYGDCYRVTTASAILQWTSALGIALYFSTLILDVWPLQRHSPPTPLVWADQTGVKGVWVVHPDDDGGLRRGRRRAVELPEGVGLHRSPLHRGEMGKRCAHVLVPHPVVEGRMVPVSASPWRGTTAAAEERKEDGSEEGWAWYSEGKGRGRRKKSGRR